MPHVTLGQSRVHNGSVCTVRLSHGPEAIHGSRYPWRKVFYVPAITPFGSGLPADQDVLPEVMFAVGHRAE